MPIAKSRSAGRHLGGRLHVRTFSLAAAAVLALAGSAAFAEPVKKKEAPATAAAPKAPPIPKPALPKDETEHWSRLDAALAPLRNFPLSADDASQLKAVAKAAAKNDSAAAASAIAEIRDPTARKLALWLRLRAGDGTASEMRDFISANPAWPERGTLVQRLEEDVFRRGGTSAEVKAALGAEPETGPGLGALAAAHLATNAWREMSCPAELEATFVERMKTLLTVADHKWRLDRLLIDDIRWADDKADRAKIVRRIIPLLPAAEQKKAEARLAVFMGGAMKAAPDAAGDREPDWGLLFHRIRALRRADKIDEAAKLMLGAPTEEAKIVAPDGWWIERRQLAYEALKAKKPKLAYELVREAGPLSANPLKEQTFMAGWLALRFLKDPKLAEPHFQAFKKAADGPLSRAKANYWLGRNAEARRERDRAAEYYRAAQADPDTFHALLARQKLEPGRQKIAVAAPAEPSREEVDRFLALDANRAVVIAKKAEIPIHIIRAFIVALRGFHKTEAEAGMVAHLAEIVGDTQSAVRAGKAAIARGQNLLYYAYPVHPFPAYTPLRKPPEPAMLLGLARQETEFNTLTVSGAGAKGILQVMTITAKHVCRDYKIKCDIPRLLSDPAYNAMIASAYIGDRMAEFSGSYILTLAGYNAGPGRARQWIREFGDPRRADVDPIDWIESIPIQETREYVGKVLANIQIYRARLGEAKPALRLDEDLARARFVGGSPVAPARQSATKDAGSDG